MLMLNQDDALAIATVDAIRTGDLQSLKRLLIDNSSLATSIIGVSDAECSEGRSLLHIATDWPGHFPNCGATISTLVAAGADVNARFIGRHTETPLHWAASSDDVEALDALIDAGADINATGAVIGGGTPLADARAFGQWQTARRLVERGATTTLQDAATLGLMDRIENYFSGGPQPTTDDITRAFWGACHGGQQPSAAYFLDKGAHINWIGWDGLTALDIARRSGAEELAGWLRTKGAKSAEEVTSGL